MKNLEFMYHNHCNNKMYRVVKLDMRGKTDQWTADLIERDNPENQLLNVEINIDNLIRYTGQRDKNGRKIWEYHIVNYPDARIAESGEYIEFTNMGLVEYCEKSMGFHFTNRENVMMNEINISEEVEIVDFEKSIRKR